MIRNLSLNYRKQINQFTVNLLFSIIIWVINQAGNEIIVNLLCYTVCFFYTIYFLTIDLFDEANNFIYNVLTMHLIITMAFRKRFGNFAIDWLQFDNILILIMFIKIAVSRRIQIFKKGSGTVLLFIFVLLFGLIGIIQFNGLWNIVCTVFFYLRIIPVYIIIAYSNRSYSVYDIKFFAYINALMFPILFLVRANLDDYGGIFGYSGSTPFSVLMIFTLGFFIGKYIEGEINIWKFILLNFVFYGFCIIAEIKFAIMIVPFLTIATVLFFNTKKSRSKKKLGKRFLVVFGAPLILVVGFIGLTTLYPAWARFIQRRGGIINYIKYYSTEARGTYSMNRFNIISMIYNSVLNAPLKKLFGLGLGFMMPPEASIYSARIIRLGFSDIFTNVFTTPFYQQYGFALGYHRSAFVSLLGEAGIIGTIIYFLFHMQFSVRSFKLVNSNIKECRAVGYAGIISTLYMVPFFIYYNSITRIRIMLVTSIIYLLYLNMV